MQTIAYHHLLTMASEPRPRGRDGLLGLPTELMEEVAKELATEDFLSLRLVRRVTENKILKVFKHRYFTEKSFLLASSWRMEALESISEHPQFRISMKKILLDLRTLVRGRKDSIELRQAQADEIGKTQ